MSFGPTSFHKTVFASVISLSESQHDFSLLLPNYLIVSSDLTVTSTPRQEAVVISGKKLARQIRDEARADVEEWVSAGHRRPHLSVILVGDNPASHSYVVNKTRAAADVGKCMGVCVVGGSGGALLMCVNAKTANKIFACALSCFHTSTSRRDLK